MTAENISFDQIQEGLERSFTYQITAKDIDSFAEISGDYSTLHMDTAFARRRGFRDRLVHGAFVGALVSRLVGMMLPGRDAVVQTIQLKFHNPTYADYNLEVKGKVMVKSEALKMIQVAISVNALNVAGILVSGKVQIGFTQERGQNAD